MIDPISPSVRSYMRSRCWTSDPATWVTTASTSASRAGLPPSGAYSFSMSHQAPVWRHSCERRRRQAGGWRGSSAPLPPSPSPSASTDSAPSDADGATMRWRSASSAASTIASSSDRISADRLSTVQSPDVVGGGCGVLPALISSSLRVGAYSPLQDLAAQRVDRLALLVHHVVVLEQVLARCRSCVPRPSSARSRSSGSPAGCSIGTSSSMPSRSIRPVMRSAPKMRSRSSSSDR